MPEDQLAQLVATATSAVGNRLWTPNIGPQSDAYFCEADELFYGGQAGGGKTDLVAGLAIEEHKKSLILRRFSDDADSIAERVMDITGTREGWNGQKKIYRWKDDKVLDFGGCKEEQDKQRYKGRPHDMICFDEVTDFLQSQFEFIIAWNRSADPDQRCRVVCTGNPPTTAEGLWVIKRWAAWLDPDHPNPAKQGELRWYCQGDSGQEYEVGGPGEHEIEGRLEKSKSRTFIRSTLEDNPDLATTNYASVLAGLPEHLRKAYRDGRFDLGLRDDEAQVIPSLWIREAQARWTEKPPTGQVMSAMGVDIARGGEDQTVIAPRYGGWYAPLIAIDGKDTPDGPTAAGFVVGHRRHGATVVIDMGGGYGGSPYDHLKQNGVDVRAYRGANKSVRKTADRQLKFTNKRSEAYWRFREALDPGQAGGSPIALPSDAELWADLTAPRFEITSNGIKITPKDVLVKNLGRSPDKGDAVVMAWCEGHIPTNAVEEAGRPDQYSSGYGRKSGMQVNLGPRRNNHVKGR